MASYMQATNCYSKTNKYQCKFRVTLVLEASRVRDTCCKQTFSESMRSEIQPIRADIFDHASFT